MGYRNYIASLPKKEYNKIKGFTLQELYAHKGEEWAEDFSEGYVGVYDVAYNCHYELGKYVDEFPKKYFKPVFKNKETQKHFTQEQDFYIVDQDFVKAVIENYTEKIRKYYNDMLNELFDGSKVKAGFMIDKNNKPTDAEMKTVFAIVDHVRSMAIEWGVAGWLPDEVPYSLDPKRDLVSSWKYEYSIFNLVNLYRTFDWKRNVMIYYGY